MTLMMNILCHHLRLTTQTFQIFFQGKPLGVDPSVHNSNIISNIPRSCLDSSEDESDPNAKEVVTHIISLSRAYINLGVISSLPVAFVVNQHNFFVLSLLVLFVGNWCYFFIFSLPIPFAGNWHNIFVLSLFVTLVGDQHNIFASRGLFPVKSSVPSHSLRFEPCQRLMSPRLHCLVSQSDQLIREGVSAAA